MTPDVNIIFTPAVHKWSVWSDFNINNEKYDLGVQTG